MAIPGITPAVVDYLTTEVELLAFGPKKVFSELGKDPSRYLNPYAFLIINMLIAAGPLTVMLPAAIPSSMLPDDASMFDIYIGALVLHICMFLLNVPILAVALLVAKVFREHVTWRDLFRSYCYASAIYPVISILLGLMMLTGDAGGDSGPASPLLMLFAGLVFIIYTAACLARGNELHGRRYFRFVLATIMSTAVVNVALVVAVSASIAVYEGKTLADVCACSESASGAK